MNQRGDHKSNRVMSTSDLCRSRRSIGWRVEFIIHHIHFSSPRFARVADRPIPLVEELRCAPLPISRTGIYHHRVAILLDINCDSISFVSRRAIACQETLNIDECQTQLLCLSKSLWQEAKLVRFSLLLRTLDSYFDRQLLDVVYLLHHHHQHRVDDQIQQINLFSFPAETSSNLSSSSRAVPSLPRREREREEKHLAWISQLDQWGAKVRKEKTNDILACEVSRLLSSPSEDEGFDSME